MAKFIYNPIVKSNEYFLIFISENMSCLFGGSTMSKNEAEILCLLVRVLKIPSQKCHEQSKKFKLRCNK